MYAAKYLLTFAFLAVVSVVPLQAQDDGHPDEFARHVLNKANELRPSAARLSWQQIPWLTNLAEALEVAEREGRPVFLWGSDDEPLERC